MYCKTWILWPKSSNFYHYFLLGYFSFSGFSIYFLHMKKVGKTKAFDKLMLKFYEVTTDFIFLKKIPPGQNTPKIKEKYITLTLVKHYTSSNK